MPIINVQLLAGSSAEARTRIAHGLTDALRLVIPAPSESFTVVVSETQNQNFMRGRSHHLPEPELPDARDVARRFFATMLEGDFLAADAFVTDDCTFHLPGDLVLHRPNEMMELAAKHWANLSTRFEGFDMCCGPEGAIVYARQRLTATNEQGLSVQDILMISRLEFRGALICKFEHTSSVSLFSPQIG